MNLFQRFVVKCFNLLYPVKIYGKENIPKGGAILTCNHFRWIDCGFMADVYNKDAYFLCKKEVFDKKLLGAIAKWFGGIPVDRQGADIKTLFSVIKLLKNGNKLIIFPEGTRNKSGTDELQELKGGTALISIKSKCPIVPVMMLKKAKIFRRTKMIVGEPFEFSEFYDKKFTDENLLYMNEVLRDKMIDLQNKLRDMQKKKGNTKTNDNI